MHSNKTNNKENNHMKSKLEKTAKTNLINMSRLELKDIRLSLAEEAEDLF